MKNCPDCHYEYDADECPECGWPNNLGKEITNTTGLSRELLKLADDNKKLRERVIEAENSAYAAKSEYGVLASNLRADLSALRADLQAAQARCAEQAAQLEQARNVIATVSLESFSTNGSDYLRMKKYVRDKCDAWLAANAPQPAPQEQHT